MTAPLPYGPARAAQWHPTRATLPAASLADRGAGDSLPHAVERCLRAGDARSALVFWRSKRWTEAERDRTLRLLGAAREMGAEVLP